MYDTCLSVLLLEMDLLTLSMCVGLKYPLLLTLYVVRWVGLALTWMIWIFFLYSFSSSNLVFDQKIILCLHDCKCYEKEQSKLFSHIM